MFFLYFLLHLKVRGSDYWEGSEAACPAGVLRGGGQSLHEVIPGKKQPLSSPRFTSLFLINFPEMSPTFINIF